MSTRSPQDVRLLRHLPLILLALTVLILFVPLLQGKVLFWGLPSLQFYPWRQFAMSELAQGRLPLWNPYNGAGVPLLANYQSALLYPPHWLYFLWSGPQMIGYLGMLHLLWAGLGMWLLTGRKTFNLPYLGRGLATLAFPLSSTIVARFFTLPMVDAAAWLPWLIYATDLLIEQQNLRRFLLLTAVAAMQLLVGHAQWTFYSLVLAGSYLTWRVVTERHSIRIMAIFGAALLFSATIAAAQLLPTAELQRQSQRAESVDETFALNFSFAPISLTTLFNPNFFGNPGNGSYAINGAYFETTAYIGFFPLTLALIGMIHYLRTRRRRNRATSQASLMPFFALVAIISLLFAMGRFIPFIYPLLFRYVPTFNLFQGPARWLLLTVFALTMLAALATVSWQPDRRSRRRIAATIAFTVGVIATGLLAQSALHNPAPLTVQMLQAITMIGLLALITMIFFFTLPAPGSRSRAIWTIGVLVFVAIDLWWANVLSNPTVPANFYDRLNVPSVTRSYLTEQYNKQVFDRLLPFDNYPYTVQKQSDYRQSGMADLNLLDRSYALNNFDPLRPEWMEQFTKLLGETPSPPLLQTAAIDSLNGAPLNAANAQRVWIVPEVVAVNSVEEAGQKMRDECWNPHQTAFVEKSASDTTPFTSGQGGTAAIQQETPLELTITADTPSGGLMVVADSYYPGWQAIVDGTPTNIYRVNMAFRGIFLQPGQHNIRLTYQPRTFSIGVVLSGVALMLYIGLSGIDIILRRRISTSP